MPRHSHREHDSTFGQVMLRLRKSIRLLCLRLEGEQLLHETVFLYCEQHPSG